jgi:benzylsuccinate CoA-transferase BbsF subunit
MSRVLSEHRGGYAIDLAMVEAEAYQFAEYFSWLARDGVEAVSQANQLDGMAPHGVYRCRGRDSWIALAIDSDEQWRCLVEVLGRPAALLADSFGRAANRAASAGIIDAELEKITQDCDRDQLFARLREASVPCAPVWSAADLVANLHMRERGTFCDVEHPRWGRRSVMGVPWRPALQGPVPISRAPLLGEHTEEVEAEWLGA